MKSKFDDFIEKIPSGIHHNTKTFIGKNMAVFIPDTYVIEKSIIVDDYHFVIFHTTPPSVTINNNEYQLKGGALLCMPPGTEITVRDMRNKFEAQYVAISIKADFFEDILLKISNRKRIKSIIYNRLYSYKILDLLEFFMQEFIYLNAPFSLMIESIETQIVVQLLRDMALDPMANKINPSQEKSYIQQAIRYMEAYYNSNITINEICNMIYLSPCHFQRIFKHAMNQTPYQYIMKFRIKKAKEILAKEKIPISEVARLCGFLNSGHFSSAFKKSEGKTPSEYRNAIDIDNDNDFNFRL